MKRIALLASLVLVAGCSQAANPTRPSPLAAQPEGLFTQTAIARIVDWSTLTAGGGNDAFVVTGEDVPSAPANLAFTLSGSTVVLTWSAPASANATSYVVEAGTATGQSNITTFNTGSTATTLTVTGVPNGTYFVRVRARNADGNSATSNEITIVVGAGPCPPPSAPAGFTASASGNTVTLTWGAVTGALGYVIEAGSAPGASNIITFDTGSSATSFSAGAPNGTYYLRARARTSCGTSTVSNEASVTVGGSAPPPGGGLTGLWTGTLTGRLTGTQQVDVTQSGTSLAGVFRNRGAGQGITLQLAETAPNTYSGTLNFEGTGGGACGAGAAAGSVQVSSGPPMAMSGTFTLPASGGCPSQSYQLSLTKQ